MPNPISVMPDDELAVIQYLRTVAVVTALVPAANIIQELPPSPKYPYLLIQRTGGQAIAWQAVDEAGIQIDSFADTRSQAKRLILAARAALLAIANDVVPEAVLAGAFEEVGPSWLPDTVTVPPQPRFTARFRVVLHK